LTKAQSRKLYDYRDVTAFKKLRFQIVFHPHEDEKPPFSNSFGLRKVFEKLRFRGGLNIEMKLRFQLHDVNVRMGPKKSLLLIDVDSIDRHLIGWKES